MNKIKVAFTFHYRNDSGVNSLREQTFKKTWAYYESKLLNQTDDNVDFIMFGHFSSNDVPYNRAASRNECVKHAKNVGADVVIIMDADTFINPKDIIKAIHLAYNENALVYPFKTYRKELHFNMLNSYLTQSWPKGGHKGLGSAYVVKPEIWESFGGADERFKTWGVEDNLTAYTAWAFNIPVKHLNEGVAFGIETRDTIRKESKEYKQNFIIQQQYEEYWNQRITPNCEQARKQLKELILKEREQNNVKQ